LGGSAWAEVSKATEFSKAYLMPANVTWRDVGFVITLLGSHLI
jgi:hypothetical protein